MSDQYIQLLQEFPPRTITNEKQLEATQAVIDRLLDGHELTTDESEHLNLLGVLIWEDEQSQEPIPDIYGVELLQVLITEKNYDKKI